MRLTGATSFTGRRARGLDGDGQLGRLDRSIGATELSAKALSFLAGPQGPQGLTGPSGISGWEYRVTPGLSIPMHDAGYDAIACRDGRKALGGGVSTDSSRSTIRTSAPMNDAAGWSALLINDTDAPDRMYVWVICAYVSS